MSACNITLSFTGTADDLFARIQTQVTANGGTLTGDASAGSFSVNALGAIDGTYTIAGQTLNIVISKKPGLIGCGTIQHFVAGHLLN